MFDSSRFLRQPLNLTFVVTRSWWSLVSKTALRLSKPFFSLSESLHTCRPEFLHEVSVTNFRIIVCRSWQAFNYPKKIFFFSIQETSSARHLLSCLCCKIRSIFVSTRPKVLILRSACHSVLTFTPFCWGAKKLELLILRCPKFFLRLKWIHTRTSAGHNNLLSLHVCLKLNPMFIFVNILKPFLQIHFLCFVL